MAKNKPYGDLEIRILKKEEALKFVAFHNKHHLKIIFEIVAA